MKTNFSEKRGGATREQGSFGWFNFGFLGGGGDVGGCGMELREKEEEELEEEQREGDGKEEDEGSLVIKSDRRDDLHD